jgi:hypothetical protein
MKIIEPGHIYEVNNVDGDGVQRIVFVRRRDSDAHLLPTKLRQEGILTQELLRVAIDRTLYLNLEAPCIENIEIVNSLRHALSLYESRAARRTIENYPMIEKISVCEICQHILCKHKR